MGDRLKIAMAIIITVLFLSQMFGAIQWIDGRTIEKPTQVKDLATCENYSQSPVTRGNDGLVAQWHMDEGSGDKVWDSSGNGNDGTLNVGVGDNVDSKWVDGVKGKALKFDGIDDYITLPEGDNITKTKRDFTISFSLKANNINAMQNILDLNCVCTTNEKGNGILIQITDDSHVKIAFYLNDDVDGRRYGLISERRLLERIPYYVTFRRCNNITTIYINSVEDNTTTTTNSNVLFSHNKGAYVGDYNSIGIFHDQADTIENPFDGVIDEVSIYNRALSASEIRAHYSNVKLSEQEEFGGSWFDDYDDDSGIEGGLGGQLKADEHTVGLWHFDEGSGNEAKDASGNGNHGTLTNMEERDWVDGKYEGGLELDGVNEYVDIGQQNLLLTEITFEAWIKTAFMPPVSGYIVGRSGQQGGGIRLAISTEGMARFHYVSSDSGNGYPIFKCDSETCVNDGKWHYIVGVRNINTILLYVDGLLVNTMVCDQSTSYEPDNTPCKIGRHGYQTNQLFKGNIDEVRISNVARTPEEIRRNYEGGLALRNGKAEFAKNEFEPGAGCVGYWGFDEGSGNKTLDGSGNGNNGTIYGGENWTEGRFGKALEFDGVNDYILIPDSEKLFPSTEITMEAWIQIKDYNNNHMIISQHSSNAAQCSFEMLIQQTNGKLVATINDGSEYIYFYSDEPVPINEWIHVAYTWDGTKSANGHSLHINGEKKSKTHANGDPTAFSSITNSPCPVFLGVRGEGFGPRLPAVQDEIFGGRMDEIQIYNRSLTPYEIGQHYNRTLHSTNATITSTPISLPENMTWDSLSITKTAPADTYINVSVINAETNATIQTFNNRTNRTIDLSQLNVDEITSIRLKAYFSGNGSATPSLDSWGVEWTAENAWRDSFTGDSKVAYPNGVDEHTVGYWRFDEGCGNVARDLSGKGNNGTLMNMDDEDWVNGKIGKGLVFDGANNYVRIPSSPKWSFGYEDFSMSVWVKLSDLDASCFISRSAHPSDGFSDNFYLGFDPIRGLRWVETTSSGTLHFAEESIMNWQIDEWYFVNVVKQSGIIALYQNGIPLVSEPINGNFISNESIDIGRFNNPTWASASYTNGIIDEVRISNIARSSEEIRLSYQAGIAIHGGQVQLGENEIVSDGNTSALWHFNEGEGNVLGDSSGNGNDGVIHGANWTEGVMGGALEFDGEDDYVKIPNDNAMSGINSFTISLWAKVNTWTNTFSFLDLINGNSHQLTFGAYANPGKLGLMLPTDQWYEFNTIMDDTSWAMYAVTRSGSTLSLYKNGFFVESKVGNAIQIGNTNGYYQSMGRTDWGAGDINYYSGTIDEVAIYNRALTASEIRAHANRYRNNATLHSNPITLPANQTWDTFHCNRTVPENTYLNITIHDATTNETLWTEYNRTSDPYVDLSAIDPVNHPSIYLNATFQSNRTETPVLRDWAVNWTGEGGEVVIQPPEMYEEILDLNFDEDSELILHLSDHFRDINIPLLDLNYTIENTDAVLNINATVTINNSLVIFRSFEPNWTGMDSFKITCNNGIHTCESNAFNVTIDEVDDSPMWKHPLENITIIEDHTYGPLNLSELVEDAEGDELQFKSSVNTTNVSINIDSGLMVITPVKDWFGKAHIDLTVKQVSNTSLYSTSSFYIIVMGENDLPITNLTFPDNGTTWTDPKITLHWSCHDPDSLPTNIQYSVYLSTDKDKVISHNLSVRDLTENTNLTVTLPDGTYYWTVIAFDGLWPGTCDDGYYTFNITTNITLPEVILLEPLDDAIINTTNVTLRWKLNDTISQGIVYHVYFGTDKDNLTEKNTTLSTSFHITGLENGLTYHWKVIPHNGSIVGSCMSGTWHFTVNTSFVAVYDITAVSDKTKLEIAQGGSEMFNITLTNNGNLPFTVTLSVTGVFAGHVNVVDGMNLPITPQKIVPVTLTVPKDFETGNYDLVIRITYPGGNETVTVPVEITSSAIIDDGHDKDTGLSGVVYGVIVGAVILILILIVAFIILRKKKKTGDEEVGEEEMGEVEMEERETEEEVEEQVFVATGGEEGFGGHEELIEQTPAEVDVQFPTPQIDPGIISPEDVPLAPQEMMEPVSETPEVPELQDPSPPPEAPQPFVPPSPEPELEQVPPSMANLIPGYTLTHKIGSGGFAAVYRAMDSQGKPVAVKVPKHLDGTVDMRVLEEFRAESDIWKKLKHKNIVTFYKGDIRPVPYMVIEYMDGGNLLDVLKGEPMPIDEAISLIKQILAGMAYAHRMASVHRDVKPENILFSTDGTPKITDWGIGKFMASESMSKTSGIKGTLAYSAPEQVSKDEFGEVDWQTDVFQLGIVFYEMLTGENPFVADDLIGVVNNIVNKIPVPPSSLRSGIPPEIDTVILRALEKDKDKRFVSADTMLSELRRDLKDREKNIAHYRKVLKRALKDGMISPDEGEMLEEFRERYSISMEEHEKMLGESIP